MQSIDERIKRALDDEDKALFDELAEPGLIGQVTAVMRGRMGWLNVIVWIVSLAFFVGGIYALVAFFNAEEIRDMLAWGGGFLFAMLVVMVMKVWFWLEMQTNSVLREIKRVELQVARLSHRDEG